jgi:hypothetical protein
MLSRHRILYNLELDILIVEYLIASFNTRRFLNIIIVISVVNIILRFSLVIVRVFRIIY